MAPTTALVAGAGDLGGAVASRLAAAGWRVVALRRRPEPPAAGVIGVAGDLTRPETLRGLPLDLDAVVYAAAADRRDEAAYRAVYVDGPANLLAALGPGTPGRRFVFVSTTAVYGDRGGAWVDESSTPAPLDFAGRVLLEAESLVRGRAPGATVARLGGIYGPGRSRLLGQVRRGGAACAPGPPAYTNRIHRDDAAAAIVHLLGLPAPPDVVNVVDDDPAPRCEVLRWLAARLGAPPPPEGPASGAGRGNKRVANGRLRATGFAPRYPSYRDGYAALIG
jgi:nucleoside-diphosphate-sugar epimerase